MGRAQLLIVVSDFEGGSLIDRSGHRPVLLFQISRAAHRLGFGVMGLPFHEYLFNYRLIAQADSRKRDAWGVYNSSSMDLGLKNRVALVAASSQGIGRATAEAFAAEGCRVAMCARNQQTLRAAAEKIRRQYSTEVFAEAFDVTNAEAVSRFVAAVAEQFGRIDICVTNAGGPPAKGFLAATLEEWQRALEMNFLSTVYFAREVIPYMQRKRWGRIITLTSITTKQPVTDLVLSNAVRTAVVGLVKSLANEFGKDGILVNNVGPGFTATDRLKELAKARAASSGKSEQEIFDAWAADAPLHRLGEPREVADTIVWLASERASYITGQTVLVDGGMYKGL
jgi:3-oxoacyl-[acyl-carrier protein] reductase